MSIPVKKILTIIVSVCFLFIVGLAGVLVYIHFSTDKLIYSFESIEEISEKEVGIVFGASVIGTTRQPSDVLADRIKTAVELYNKGKISKIIMSGDNRETHYNEPQVMSDYAQNLGVSEHDIILDLAGYRTYDTCYRVKHEFGFNEAILVTQKYHLYRALYTCRALGIDVEGASSSLQEYRDQFYFNLREIPATLLAFWEVHIDKPEFEFSFLD